MRLMIAEDSVLLREGLAGIFTRFGCEVVAAVGTVIDPDVVHQLLVHHRAHDPLDALSPREREVLALVAEGRSNSAIAQRLYVSEAAVAKHVTGVYTKLGLSPDADDHRRVLAALTFLRSR